MTRKTHTRLALGASAFSLALASCGGSGGSSPSQPIVTPPPPPPPVGSTDTNITVQGPIQGFGSVIVNGERYGTDEATVIIDGEERSLNDLSVGQIVALRATRKGDDELPTALRVRYEEALEGRVEAISEDGSEITILGITVFVTDDTVFEDDLDPATIMLDDVLEVSGSFASETELVASYIEEGDAADSDYEVHGTVGGLDTANQTFRVRGLKISYANAALEDFEDGNELSNGDKVEVEGSTFLNDGTLNATVVEYEGDDFEEFEGEDGDEAEIEGIITTFVSETEFTVGDIVVTTTSDTEFERGTAADLAEGVRVEVEGEYDETGALVADEIKFEFEANIRVTAAIDDFDADAQTVTLLGLTFVADEDTKFKDKGQNAVREFGFDDFAMDDVIRVRAYELADGTLLAKRIERGPRDEMETELRGYVDENSETAFVVQGVEVLIDAETEFEYGDVETSAEEFFAQILIEDYVKIEGEETEDGLLLAREIEFETEDEEDDD